MVESSFSPFRVGAAAIPDSIMITRQKMIPWRCLTLTPPFLNPPSLETLHPPGGSLWWAPGPAALLVSEGCPSGCRSCPRALYFPWPAVQHPTDRAIVHSGGPHPSASPHLRHVPRLLLIPALSLARSARFGGCHYHSAPCVLPPRVPRLPGGWFSRPSWRVRPYVSRVD